MTLSCVVHILDPLMILYSIIILLEDREMFNKWWKNFIFCAGLIIVIIFVGFNGIIKEVGSWADWFGAFGTIGAVWIALYLSREDRRVHFKDKQIEDLNIMYKLVWKMYTISELIDQALNHFEYYDSDGAETHSSNDKARLHLMRKINREKVQSILDFENDLDNLNLIKDLLTDTKNTNNIKNNILELKKLFYILHSILNTIQYYENSGGSPEDNEGAQYSLVLTEMDTTYKELKKNIAEEIKRIKKIDA